MHGMEDLLGGPARQDERELGCEPDLRALLDRAIYYRREHSELHGMDNMRAWGTCQDERELGCEPHLRTLLDRAI